MSKPVETNNVALTSIKQVAALLKKAPLSPGTVNLDLGGGKYDEGVHYLAQKGVTSYVLDPFNRSEEHNSLVKNEISAGVDTVTLANVLNVIENPDIRQNVLREASTYLKTGGLVYINVYEGNRSGKGRKTKIGTWQENRRLSDYIEEVKMIFPNAKIVKGYIVATK